MLKHTNDKIQEIFTKYMNIALRGKNCQSAIVNLCIYVSKYNFIALTSRSAQCLLFHIVFKFFTELL